MTTPFFYQLENEIGDEKVELLLLEQTICNDLNFTPAGDWAAKIERGGVFQNEITISDAVYLFLKRSFPLFKKKNRHLSDEMIIATVSKIGEYLVRYTEWQHKMRILKSRALGAKNVYELLEARRDYNPCHRPERPTLEYTMNIRLRKGQIKIIN